MEQNPYKGDRVKKENDDLILSNRNLYVKAGYLYNIVVFLLIFFSIFSSLFFEESISDSPFTQWIANTILVTIISIFVPAVFFTRGGTSPEFHIKKIGLATIILSVCAGVGVFCLSSALETLFSYLAELTGADLTKISSELPPLNSPVSFIAATVLICVLPAICEETLFRGAILYSWRGMGMKKAAFITALMFTLLHTSLVSFPALLVIGYTLGIIAFSTRSVYPCIIIHFINNFISLIFTAAGQAVEATSEIVSTSDTLLTVVFFALIGVVILSFTIPSIFKQAIKSDKKDKQVLLEQIPDTGNIDKSKINILLCCTDLPDPEIRSGKIFPWKAFLVSALALLFLSVFGYIASY